jgi:hypothetical protein
VATRLFVDCENLTRASQKLFASATTDLERATEYVERLTGQPFLNELGFPNNVAQLLKAAHSARRAKDPLPLPTGGPSKGISSDIPTSRKISWLSTSRLVRESNRNGIGPP